MAERPTAAIRRLLAEPKLTQIPGVIDAAWARVIAAEGFDAVYMTGAGTSASRLGWPDVGLLTMSEMVDNAGRIADASIAPDGRQLPLLADADTGYGGPLNVRRTIQAYERAGVAGVHIEDQVWPKRCGHLAGKAVVPTADMVAHIKAACDARHDQDFAIIARTDAIAVEGFEAGLARAHAYAEAGADVLFIEAMTSEEQLAEACRQFDKPLLYNMASSGKTPFLSAQEMQDLGFSACIYPNFVMLAAIPAVQDMLRTLKETGEAKAVVDKLASFQQFFDLLGMDRIKELEEKYAVSNDRRVGY
ncbi:MAG TPA: oxaloacetate decarboxylase [Alphaproteobacteria bacterium]|nr:oxaloacetate decarboxylase [Alphaproteobacteria bacterium]